MAQTALRTVAIAGSSGHLGSYILASFQSSLFRESFKDVILLKRKGSSAPSEANTTTRVYDEDNLSESLKDVDVLISAVGPAGHGFKDKLIGAMAKSNVKLYIPSEFGIDHTVHDFDHVEWGHKKHHFDLAASTLQSTKICRIFIGLFIEDSIGPWFGFNTKDGVHESIGSSDTPVSFTSLGDVGNAVAQVAGMPLEDVPDQLHIGGDTVSWRQVAETMQEAGAGEIKLKELDLAESKQKVFDGKTSDPSRYLRFLAGEGRINHTSDGLGNDNELVNPGQSLWKWKTIKDYAVETKGRPWADLDWSENSVS